MDVCIVYTQGSAIASLQEATLMLSYRQHLRIYQIYKCIPRSSIYSIQLLTSDAMPYSYFVIYIKTIDFNNL
jgi:hypothetical protein